MSSDVTRASFSINQNRTPNNLLSVVCPHGHEDMFSRQTGSQYQSLALMRLYDTGVHCMGWVYDCSKLLSTTSKLIPPTGIKEGSPTGYWSKRNVSAKLFEIQPCLGHLEGRHQAQAQTLPPATSWTLWVLMMSCSQVPLQTTVQLRGLRPPP